MMLPSVVAPTNPPPIVPAFTVPRLTQFSNKPPSIFPIILPTTSPSTFIIEFAPIVTFLITVPSVEHAKRATPPKERAWPAIEPVAAGALVIRRWSIVL